MTMSSHAVPICNQLQDMLSQTMHLCQENIQSMTASDAQECIKLCDQVTAALVSHIQAPALRATTPTTTTGTTHEKTGNIVDIVGSQLLRQHIHKIRQRLKGMHYA